jgi:hypothetical protein
MCGLGRKKKTERENVLGKKTEKDCKREDGWELTELIVVIFIFIFGTH